MRDFIKASVIFFAVVINSGLVLLVIYELYNAALVLDFSKDFIYILELVATRLTLMATILVVYRQRKVLRCIHTTVNAQIKEEYRKRIYTFTKRLLVCWILYFPLQFVAVSLVWWSSKHLLDLSDAAIGQNLLSAGAKATYTAFWTIPSMVTYAVCVYMIGLCREQFFAQSEAVQSTPRLLRDRWALIKRVTNTFDSAFSPIPMLWYANFFMTCAAYVVSTCNPNNRHPNVVIVVANWLQLSMNFLMSVAIVLLINHFNERARDQLVVLESHVNGVKSSFLMESECLRMDIKQNVEFSLTGWQLFVVNKEFVLSFISTTITFSTMFLQMASSQAFSKSTITAEAFIF